MTVLLRGGLLALVVGLSGCGQAGPLYLPDEGLDTPVEIRPAEAAEAEEKKPDE